MYRVFEEVRGHLGLYIPYSILVKGRDDLFLGRGELD